jgi:catechol 1,2-dioxygenase
VKNNRSSDGIGVGAAREVQVSGAAASLGVVAKGTMMIASHAQQLTDSVLAEMNRAQDPRLREILGAAVRHLHAFAAEVKLSETEFQQACAWIARLGQLTTASHNEVVLCAGSLGLSSLVCLLNNGDAGRTPTTANLLGPFWRDDSPPTANGGSIVRSPTPGEPIFVTAWVKDTQGRPVAGAEVDVWHSSAEGYYENQDPQQADMNLRGRFITDASGCIRFRSIKPLGYPIPVDGVVGELLRALGRHNMRPAHLHFLIHKPGFKTQFSQVYSNDDPNLETDVQFGVTQTLIGRYVRHQDGPAPAPDIRGPWHSLEHSFVIEPGEARRPRPPITGKASGAAPTRTTLERRPE